MKVEECVARKEVFSGTAEAELWDSIIGSARHATARQADLRHHRTARAS
jgi:hypothetical protein